MPAFNELRSPSVSAELARLRRRFPRIEDDFERGLDELRAAADWLGDIIPGYHPRTFKTRIGLRSANIGKRGGLRLVYRPVPASDDVITALIYYKRDADDFSKEELQRALAAVRPEVEPALLAAGLSQKQIDELFAP